MTLRLLPATLVLTASLLPVGADAQMRRHPGAPGGDGYSAAAARAEFYADVLEHTNEVLSKWRQAWADDDLDAVLELYTEDALFIFTNDAPVQGREAIREKLVTLLETTGEVQAAFTDFDASGRMGLISGLLTFQMQDARRSRTVGGLHMTVLIRQGRDWKIRSQLFRLDEPVDGAGAAAGPGTPGVRLSGTVKEKPPVV